MREEQPVTQTINASQARQQWSELLDKVFRRETRVIVEKSGIPVAAVISAEDLDRLTKLEDARRERFKALEETWAAFKDVPPEEIEREVARALDQVRAQNRRKGQQPSGTL